MFISLINALYYLKTVFEVSCFIHQILCGSYPTFVTEMSQKNKHPTLSMPYSIQESSKIGRRDRQKFTKPSTPTNAVEGCIHHPKERHHHEKLDNTNQHLLKTGSIAKQQNVPSANSSPLSNIVQYSTSDDSALVEVTVKTSNAHKQRSKSTVSGREPWSQMLKKNKGGTTESVFCNFDPLRTLHFLAKELQIQVQTLLPEELNIQEIIKGMQLALKRVPPEVASTIHLQQSIGLIPGLRKTTSERSFDRDVAEKPYSITEDKGIQTIPMQESEEVTKIHKLMAESTVKLETSCRHLETLCTQLNNEKLYLEGQLQSERSNTASLKKRIEELEIRNKDLTHTLYKKDEQITQFKMTIETLETKVQETHSTKTETKTVIGELKKSKLHLEQECVKLKHQLRLCAIEKEKYVAVLGVRDRQIQEIRNEMTQLQEVVNEQLINLHNNALAAMPSSASIAAQIDRENKRIMENTTIASNHCNGDENYDMDIKCSDEDLHSKKDSIKQSGQQNVYYQDNVKHFVSPGFKKVLECPIPESQTTANIRDMFNDLKRQAFALTSTNE